MPKPDWLSPEVLAAVKASRSIIPVRADKRPAIAEWKPYQDRRPTGEEFTAWAGKKPAGWAQVCGEVSGVITIDFDGDAGAETMRELGLSPHRRTGSGGFHVDIAYPGFHIPTLNGKAKAELGRRWPGVDVRGDGGYAIIAGRNESGAYEWLRPIDPDLPDVLPAEFWAFLKDERDEPAGSAAPPPPASDRGRREDVMLRRALADAPSMGRNSAGFALAIQARDNGLSQSEAEALLQTFAARAPAHNLKGKIEPYTEAEQRASVAEAYRRPAREPWPEREPYGGGARRNGHTAPDDSGGEAPAFRRTDAGNARLFAYLYGDRLRYDHQRGRWLQWDGERWRPDDVGDVHQLAIKAAQWRYGAAGSIGDLKERTAEAAFAIQSENRAKVEAALALAQTEPGIADAGVGWDTSPWLLGIGGGVVDVGTGELRPARREDALTMSTGYAFDPEATCPRWERFLEEIFDPELIDFVWRAVGYSLTGLTIEQVVFLLWGRGANGKSVFLAVLRALLGDYAYNAPFTLFELSNRPAIPNDLAALVGRRLVTASETNEGTRLNEARIKALTGGDPITARFLYGEPFTFEPTCKIWLAVNHRPRVHDDSHGFWRRVRLIPFTRQFQGEADDKRLAEKLRAELPGILNWAIRGALEWQARGLDPPASVRAATESYRAESDPLGGFLTESCIIGADYSTAAGALYRAYQSWATEQGFQPREVLTNNAFGRLMGERFDKRAGRNVTTYYGIGLRNQQQHPLTVDPEPESGIVSDVVDSESDNPPHPISFPMHSLTREKLENPPQFTTSTTAPAGEPAEVLCLHPGCPAVIGYDDALPDWCNKHQHAKTEAAP